MSRYVHSNHLPPRLCGWTVALAAMVLSILASAPACVAATPFSPAGQTVSPSPDHPSNAGEALERITKYTLPPDRLVQSVELARLDHILYFSEFGVTLLLLLVLLRTGALTKIAQWAGTLSRWRILQACGFTVILLGLVALASLPMHIYGHVLEIGRASCRERV